jgi:thioesterase domain-containing protein
MEISIGRPIDNTDIYVLDEKGRLLPIGLAGELHVGGIGLARAYLNNPELTAAKFIPHPYKPGERLYRTGDLARWLPDGNIEYLGRIDHQLKIRGYRIEAGEIEYALLAHPSIQSAVVIAHTFEGGKELVAYLVPSTDQILPDSGELRVHLAATLPDYMLPAYYVPLEKLPLTSSGKIDRRALPAPTAHNTVSGTIFLSPRNPLEQALADIWSEVLNINGTGGRRVGIHDDFFHLGGHSLKAIRLQALMASRLRVSLPLTIIYQYPRLSDMALQLQHSRSTSLPLGMFTNTGNQQIVFAFPPALGLAVYYRYWSKRLGDYPVYAFDFVEDENLLERYYREMIAVQPARPYLIMGYSLGGNLAYDFVLYLESQGVEVSDLILLDSGVRGQEEGIVPDTDYEAAARSLIEYVEGLQDLDEEFKQLLTESRNVERIVSFHAYGASYPTRDQIRANIHLLMSGDDRSGDDGWKQWGAHTRGKYREYQGVGEHIAMFQRPWLDDNAAILLQLLDSITTGGHPAISVESALPPEERLLQLWQEYRELSAELLLLQQHEELRE